MIGRDIRATADFSLLGPVRQGGAMSSSRDRLLSRLVAGVTLLGSAGAGWATYRFAVGSGSGQRVDQEAMNTVYAGPDARLAVLSVLGNVSIGAVVVVMLVCVGLALARGHSQWAIGAVIVIAGANLTTQVLKHVVLDRPDFGLSTLNSLPSGHTTVVASATAAMLLTAPPALRAVTILGGSAATTLTAASTIVAGWHRPSDVVAALAVTLLWAAAASAVLSRRVVHTRGAVVATVVGAAAGIIVLVVLGVRPTTGWDGIGGAALVLGATAALVAVFTATVSLLAFDDDVSRETIDTPAENSSAIGVAGSPLTADRPGA